MILDTWWETSRVYEVDGTIHVKMSKERDEFVLFPAWYVSTESSHIDVAVHGCF
jgi:hypothetical protein